MKKKKFCKKLINMLETYVQFTYTYLYLFIHNIHCYIHIFINIWQKSMKLIVKMSFHYDLCKKSFREQNNSEVCFKFQQGKQKRIMYVYINQVLIK